MVDRYGLTPFASTQSANQAAGIQKDHVFSSFTANVPLGMYMITQWCYSVVLPMTRLWIGTQRTYILPRPVTAIHHTTSALGISNKNIIVAVAPGQVRGQLNFSRC
jgi:hypothetical protein